MEDDFDAAVENNLALRFSYAVGKSIEAQGLNPMQLEPIADVLKDKQNEFVQENELDFEDYWYVTGLQDMLQAMNEYIESYFDKAVGQVIHFEQIVDCFIDQAIARMQDINPQLNVTEMVRHLKVVPKEAQLACYQPEQILEKYDME